MKTRWKKLWRKCDDCGYTYWRFACGELIAELTRTPWDKWIAWVGGSNGLTYQGTYKTKGGAKRIADNHIRQLMTRVASSKEESA